MSLAADIVAVGLAIVLAAVAARKLSHRPDVVASYERVGVPEERLNLLAAILFAGAAGLLVGLIWPPLGTAAALGLVAYFGLAVAAHIRFKDVAHIGPPVGLLLVSGVALILRLL